MPGGAFVLAVAGVAGFADVLAVLLAWWSFAQALMKGEAFDRGRGRGAAVAEHAARRGAEHGRGDEIRRWSLEHALSTAAGHLYWSHVELGRLP